MIELRARNFGLFSILLFMLLVSCHPSAAPTPEPSITPLPTQEPTATSIPNDTATASPTPSATPTETVTPSQTPTATEPPTPTDTLTPSLTPTATDTPTITPTLPPAEGTVNEQSYCRYGPGTAYMAAYGLFEGDRALLFGKNLAEDWLYVQSPWWDYKCWIKATLITTDPADLANLPRAEADLPLNPAVNSPRNVQAIRNGTQVTISWSDASPQVELSYLVEAKVCQGGEIVEVAYQTTYTSYTLTDESGCAEASTGQVYLRNKLGYSAPIIVAWP